MTTLLLDVPVDRIEQAAAEVDFARGTRRFIAAMIYYPARFVGSLVSGLGWCVAAWKVGYADGRRRPRPITPATVPDRTTR